MNTDPIIAALRKQRRLYDAYDSAIENTPKFGVAQRAYNAGFDKVLRTRPRTRAGAAALIKHCLADGARFPAADEGGDAVTLLHTLAKAMPALRD